MDFDAEDGGASANSLCTVEFADDFLVTECLGTDDWQGYSLANKQAALIQATKQLEGLRYKGAPTTTTQALSFPRARVPKKNGYGYYDHESTPADMKRACSWLAFELMQGQSEDGGEDLSAFKSVAIGDEKYELRDGRTDGMPSEVKVLLRDFLLTSQARILRA